MGAMHQPPEHRFRDVPGIRDHRERSQRSYIHLSVRAPRFLAEVGKSKASRLEAAIAALWQNDGTEKQLLQEALKRFAVRQEHESPPTSLSTLWIAGGWKWWRTV